MTQLVQISATSKRKSQLDRSGYAILYTPEIKMRKGTISHFPPPDMEKTCSSRNTNKIQTMTIRSLSQQAGLSGISHRCSRPSAGWWACRVPPPHPRDSTCHEILALVNDILEELPAHEIVAVQFHKDAPRGHGRRAGVRGVLSDGCMPVGEPILLGDQPPKVS